MKFLNNNVNQNLNANFDKIIEINVLKIVTKNFSWNIFVFDILKKKIFNVLIVAIEFRNLNIFKNNFENAILILKTLFIVFKIVKDLKTTFENYVTIKFSQQNFVQKLIFKIV